MSWYALLLICHNRLVNPIYVSLRTRICCKLYFPSWWWYISICAAFSWALNSCCIVVFLFSLFSILILLSENILLFLFRFVLRRTLRFFQPRYCIKYFLSVIFPSIASRWSHNTSLLSLVRIITVVWFCMCSFGDLFGVLIVVNLQSSLSEYQCSG